MNAFKLLGSAVHETAPRFSSRLDGPLAHANAGIGSWPAHPRVTSSGNRRAHLGLRLDLGKAKSALEEGLGLILVLVTLRQTENGMRIGERKPQ
jgi:hypothetical protein